MVVETIWERLVLQFLIQRLVENNDYTFFLNSYEGNSFVDTQYSTTDKNPSWYNNSTPDGYVQISDNAYKDSVNDMVVAGRLFVLRQPI